MRFALLTLFLAACGPDARPDPADSGAAGDTGDTGDTGETGDTTDPDDRVLAEVEAGDLSCPALTEGEVRAFDPAALPQGPSPCREPELGRVVSVTDGDTFHLRRESDDWEETVRIIGVDTPETYGGTECFGPEAKAFTRESLEDRLLWLTFDYDCEDDYGRTLSYVILAPEESCFFERLLLRGGFAETMSFPATSTFEDTFSDDEYWAWENEQGMWAVCE